MPESQDFKHSAESLLNELGLLDDSPNYACLLNESHMPAPLADHEQRSDYFAKYCKQVLGNCKAERDRTGPPAPIKLSRWRRFKNWVTQLFCSKPRFLARPITPLHEDPKVIAAIWPDACHRNPMLQEEGLLCDSSTHYSDAATASILMSKNKKAEQAIRDLEILNLEDSGDLILDTTPTKSDEKHTPVFAAEMEKERIQSIESLKLKECIVDSNCPESWFGSDRNFGVREELEKKRAETVTEQLTSVQTNLQV